MNSKRCLFPTSALEEAVMLKSFLHFSAAIAILLIFLPTPNLGGMPQEATPAPAPSATGGKNPVKATPEAQAKAKKLYAVDCAMCHGDNGNGKTDLAKDMELTLKDWTDPAALANKQDGELFDAIRKGKDKMPPEAEGRASNAEVWNLIHYIRNMSKGQPSAPPPAAPAPPSN
jgi:mono/diheme cytochrome c family protein